MKETVKCKRLLRANKWEMKQRLCGNICSFCNVFQIDFSCEINCIFFIYNCRVQRRRLVRWTYHAFWMARVSVGMKEDQIWKILGQKFRSKIESYIYEELSGQDSKVSFFRKTWYSGSKDMVTLDSIWCNFLTKFGPNYDIKFDKNPIIQLKRGKTVAKKLKNLSISSLKKLPHWMNPKNSPTFLARAT